MSQHEHEQQKLEQQQQQQQHEQQKLEQQQQQQEQQKLEQQLQHQQQQHQRHQQHPPASKMKLIKNLLCLSLSFLLMFTSYQGLASLQSSVNSIGGLGTAGLAVTYACVVPSSLVLAPLALDRLGSKRTMTVCLLGYLAYFCLNLLPDWGTIIPGSAVLGLCGAPLWAAMSVHVVTLAGDFDRLAAAPDESQSKGPAPPPPLLTRRSTSLFFGVFFTIVTSCTIWGNLISYLALNEASGGSGSSVNLTGAAASGNLSCGYRFCSATAGTGGAGASAEAAFTERPSMAKFYTMMGCFIGTAGLSVLVMLLLVDRNDSANGNGDDGGASKASARALVSRVRDALVHLGEPRQLLLAPLTIAAGLSQSFSVGDFTEGFVACSSGVAAVGLVMMSYGVSQVVTGLLAGQTAARVGQAPVLLTAALAFLAMTIGSLYWEVGPEPQWPLHAMAAGWGAVDSVWVTLLNALYGDYFPDNINAAFSALRFWQSLGFILGFSYNKLLCMAQKLHVMAALICLGGVTFVVCALVNRRLKVKRINPHPAVLIPE